jgi:hypothetical protein
MQSLKPDEFDGFGEVMSFTLMNGKRVAIQTKLAKRIITTELSNQIYWMHNGMLTREEILDFLENRYDEELLKKIAYYILFFAENLVFTNILFTASESEKEMQDYLKAHIPLLEKLRELYRSCKVAEMLDECMEMGIDPL